MPPTLPEDHDITQSDYIEVTHFSDDMTLRQVRAAVEKARWRRPCEGADAGGVECPACGQLAKVYRRLLSAAMAEAVILLERATRKDRSQWIHMGRLLQAKARNRTAQGGGEHARLRFHGLTVEQAGERSDGSSRVGYYQITSAGVAFARGEAEAPKYAYLYAQACLGVSEEKISIFQALGKRFDYSVLMSGGE